MNNSLTASTLHTPRRAGVPRKKRTTPAQFYSHEKIGGSQNIYIRRMQKVEKNYNPARMNK